ncbi:hypothetical protein [Mesobacillus zeae]|uniref:hypothetical protein n=1 Tax=Mesobacillus zeae TaxID=1917180 RepID=UPI00300A7F41
MGKQPQKQLYAATLLEQFIEEGKYPELKKTEKKTKKFTSSLRSRLETSESKRHVFDEFNLVGRFTAKKDFSTDYIGLNEYLYDIGLLFHVVEIDNELIQKNELYLDMIQDFKFPDTFYIKPNLNKAGKDLIKLPSSFVISEEMSLNEIVKELALLKPRVKELTYEYKKLKNRLIKFPEIQQLFGKPKKLRKPIPHKYGSLSVVANQPKYDIQAIYDYLGEWMLIEYGKPNSELLEQFILNGTITKKEIDQFRTIVDIRLDFSVMSIEDESKLLSMLDNKTRHATANRLGA